MITRVSLAAFAVLALCISVDAFAQEDGKDAYPREVKLDKFGTHFWVDVPAAYFEADRKDEKWPLIVGLHGAGDQAKNFLMSYYRFRDDGYVIAAPKSPGNAWAGNEDKLVLAVIEEVKKSHRIDPKRVTLTGFSSGSFFGMPLAFRIPEQFNALIAVGGGGAVGVKPQARLLKVYLLSGELDPVKGALESANEQLKKKGIDSTFRIAPGIGHVWPPDDEMDLIRKWLHSFSPQALKEAELLEKVAEAKKSIKKGNVAAAIKTLIEIGESGPDCPAVLDARKELEALSTAAQAEIEKAKGLIEAGKTDAAKAMLNQTVRKYAGLPESEEAKKMADDL